MNAIEILRAASRSVPNEDYVQFMAAVDGVAELIEAGHAMLSHNPAHCDTDDEKRMRAALANVGGAP